jgi:PAS domain S-box-containing protein
VPKAVHPEIVIQLTRVLCYGLILAVVAIISLLIFYSDEEPKQWLERVSPALIGVVGLWLLRRGRIHAAAGIALWGSWLCMIVLSFLHGGVAAPAMYLFAVLLAFSAMVFGLPQTIVLCVATALASAGMVFLPTGPVSFSLWPNAGAIVVLGCLNAAIFLVAARLLKAFAAAAVSESQRRIDSEQQLDSIIHSVPAIVWEADAETFNFTFVSKAAEPILGYPCDRWITEAGFWRDHIHPDDRDIPISLCSLSTMAKEAHTFEYRMIAADGRIVWIREIVGVAVKDDKPCKLRGVMVDITERKLAENVQRESQVRLSLVVKAANIGWWELDPESHRVEYSDEFINQLGYTRSEFSNDLLERQLLVHPDDLSRATAAMQALLADDQAEYFIEIRMWHKDGTFRWVQSRAQVLRDETGRLTRVLGAQWDITEQKYAEQIALRSQRLESLGTLASGVAHDLNNALAPILMGIELVRVKYPDASKIVEVFESSAQRGTDMVRQLLAFAKGTEGERIPVQINLLVNEIHSLMKGSFPKSIELVINCEHELLTVVGNVTQLYQVLVNLVVNARDAMPQGGKLTLRALESEIESPLANSLPGAKCGNYVKLQVCDTGTGISPEVLAKIFDPFFTTKTGDMGTGLGLSTVHGIVKSHGGFIQVHSRPGEGTEFNVYLPVRAAQPSQEKIVKEAFHFHGHGEIVLFVDDEIFIRTMAEVVLRRLNLNPVIAQNGEEALIQAAEHSSELRAVISDFHMPVMGGLDFIRALRRMLPDIPIAISSGTELDEASILELKTLGVTLYLAKPFTERELGEVLTTLFADEPPR